MQFLPEKTLNPLVPVLFIEAIQDRLRSYDGTQLRKPHPCSDYGDQNHRKHNIEEQIFAVLITEDDFEEATVEYRRYWCENCEKPALPDMSPLFHKDCHYGRSIVDLCLFYTAENQYSIQVDRDTIQRCAERFGDKVADSHSVQIAGSTVSMNFLATVRRQHR